MSNGTSQDKQIVIVKPNLGYMVVLGVLSAIATSYVLKAFEKSNIPVLSGPKDD